MKNVVLDASALMEFLEARRGAETTRDLIDRGMDGSLLLSMSVVNWGEVLYSVWRAKGREAGDVALGQISQLAIEIVDVDRALTRIAAEFHAQYKLPYADCFAAALARQRGAAIATADRDFARIEQVVEIYWTV